MVYAIITAIIFAIVAIVGVVLLVVDRIEDMESLVMRVIGGVALAAGAILFFFIPWSFHTIDAGEIAVVKHMGEISGTRTPGTYFDFWMTDTYQVYDAKVQNVDIETATYSNDSQTMDIQMTIQYQIQQDKVVEIATTYGSLEVLENRIESVSVEQMKSVLAQYIADDIIANRAKISPEVADAVRTEISGDYYVRLTTVVLTDISFTDAFEQAAENKKIAEQEMAAAITRAEQELKVAKKAAEAAIAKANGDAAAQKALAGAQAYETTVKIARLAQSLGYTIEEITEEQATGEVNEEGEAITETVVVGYKIDWETATDQNGRDLIFEYLKYLEYLSTWNGELPDVVAGSDSLQLLIPTNPAGDSTAP